MSIVYVDLENGNDANDGLSFANRKKTLNSALTGTANNTEIRVMGKPTNLVGSCFFAIDNRNSNFSSTVSAAYDYNGQIEISTSNSPGWSTGDWILIEGADLAQNDQDQSLINGVWNIEIGSSSSRYLLVGSDSSGVTTWSPSDKATADVYQADGFILQLDDDPTDGPYVKKLSDGLQWVYNVAPPSGGEEEEGPTYPDWLKTYTELRSQTISGVYSTNTQLASTEETYGGAIEFGPQSKWEIVTTSTGATVTALEWTADQMMDRNAAGSTNLLSYSLDDGYRSLSIPWNTSYNGYSYSGSSVYFGTNSYITFGGAYTTYSNLSQSNPYVRKILVGADDNSAQYMVRLTEGTSPNRVHRVRFEGRNSTSGTVGSPNIVWEAQFFENDPSKIILLVDQHARYSSSAFTGPGGGDAGAPVDPGYYPFRSTSAFDVIPIRPAEQFNIGDGSPTNGKLFHTPLPSSTDLSAFSKLCFQVRRIAGAHANGTVSLRLCSDTTGDTSVYTIPLPDELSDSTYGENYNYPVTFTFPSAPSTNIQSIALYSDTTNALNASYVIYGIVATRNGLSYECVLGENVAPEGVKSPWYQPLLFDYRKKSGTTDYTTVILLAGRYGRQGSVRRDLNVMPEFGGRYDIDISNATYVGSQGMRLTYTANLYSIDTIRGALPTSSVTSTQSWANDTNINDSYVRVLCGYNESDMTVQDGYTIVDKLISLKSIGIRLYSKDGVYIERLGSINAYYGIYMSSGSDSNVFKDCIFANGYGYGVYGWNVKNNTWDGVTITNCYNGIYFSSNTMLNTIRNSSFTGGNYVLYHSQASGNRYIKVFAACAKNTVFYNNYTTGNELHDCVLMQSYSRGLFCYYSDSLKIYGGKLGPFRSNWVSISAGCGPLCFDTEFRGYISSFYLSTSTTNVSWRKVNNFAATNINNPSHSSTFGNDEMYHGGVRGYLKSVTDTLPDGSSGRVRQLQMRTSGNNYRWMTIPVFRSGFIGGEEVTVTVPIKRSSTSSIYAKLSMRASSINGLDDVLESSEASGSANTWENLSLTFTPVTDGIIEIDLFNYITSTSHTLKIGPVTVE